MPCKSSLRDRDQAANPPTCMVMVGVVSPPAAVSVVCAADTVMAVGLITWLERVAMVPKVVMGVAREALVLWPPAPARLVDTVPVTVPSVVTPAGGEERQVEAVSPLGQAGGRGQGAPSFREVAMGCLWGSWPAGYTPVVPFTTNVVTAGLTAETVTGVTRRTPPMGTVRRMVPGCPGAPFSTTWNNKAECRQRHLRAYLRNSGPCLGELSRAWDGRWLLSLT